MTPTEVINLLRIVWTYLMSIGVNITDKEFWDKTKIIIENISLFMNKTNSELEKFTSDKVKPNNSEDPINFISAGESPNHYSKYIFSNNREKHDSFGDVVKRDLEEYKNIPIDDDFPSKLREKRKKQLEKFTDANNMVYVGLNDVSHSGHANVNW